MQYRDYTYLDFMQDQFFVEWILQPTIENDRFWQDWLALNPHREKEILTAKTIIKSLRYSRNYELSERSYVDMQENIIRYYIEHQNGGQLDNANRSMLFKYAAVVGVLIIVSAVAFLNWPKSEQVITAHVETITKSTPAGAKMKLILPDGSIVNLNSLTTITFPSQFDDKERVIHLSGEAFFDVKRDPTKPFVILTENLTTRVLGTSFNIKAYPGEEFNKVAVTQGSVKVFGRNDEEVVVSKSEMLTLNLKKITYQKTLFDPLEETGWKDNIIYFKEIPLSKAFEKLEKWFAVKIHCNENIRLSDIYTGEYSSETLDNILDGISFTSGFEYKIIGKDVYIKKGKEVDGGK